MRERSEEEQPPKLKTYSLELTLIKLFRNYIMYSSAPYPCAFVILPRQATLTGSPSSQYLATGGRGEPRAQSIGYFFFWRTASCRIEPTKLLNSSAPAPTPGRRQPPRSLSAFGLSLGRSREHLGSSNTLSDSINAQFHDADLVRDHPQHIFDVPQIHGQRGNLNGYLFLSGLHRG